MPQLLAWLNARDIQARYDDQTAAYARRADGVPREKVPDGIQLMIVLGGDGTLLSAARAIAWAGDSDLRRESRRPRVSHFHHHR